MNWIIDDDGRARFTDPRGHWRVGVDPARPEAGLWIAHDPQSAVSQPADSGQPAGPSEPRAGSADAAGELPPAVRIFPPPGQQFPPLLETYPRGADLIASLLQTRETEFGLNLCHRILRADDQWLVCETIMAVQTDLLDSHPTLDVVCDAAGEPLEILSGGCNSDGGTSLISAAEEARSSSLPPTATRLGAAVGSGACFILLPPSDRAVAEDRSGASEHPVCYRLLAEFLEKGVIRKARFWTCCAVGQPSPAEIAERYAELMHLPLPLTP